MAPCAWLSYYADGDVVTQEVREYLLGKTVSLESNIYAYTDVRLCESLKEDLSYYHRLILGSHLHA